jgi:hypothetical protein
MSQSKEPSAEPIMLAALCGVLALVACFAAGVYWAAQPTILTNAGVSGFHAEMRRATAMANALLANERKRASIAAVDDRDRQSLDALVREAAGNDARRLVVN